MFSDLDSAIQDMHNGKMLILVDDENRENEGDLFLPAEKTDSKHIAFMLANTSGIICCPVSNSIAKQFGLRLMTKPNDKFNTSFTISVDSSATIGSSVSASGRAETIRALANPDSGKKSIVMPGHVFPLLAREGGVLKRAGHTEAAVDLLKLAGMQPVGVIAEIINPDGSMARLPELIKFSEKHGIRIILIKDIIKARMANENLVERVVETGLPTDFGKFRIFGYKDKIFGESYVALVKGNVQGEKNVLVRVHSGCLTGDVFFSKRCDCRGQLSSAMKMIESEGKGVLLYISHHEGRGIGLINKLLAYKLQDSGKDTVEANKELGLPVDSREYGFAAQILADLGLSSIRLITNNPGKIAALECNGLKIVERVPVFAEKNCFNEKYLSAKKEKLGHLIE